MCLAQGPQRSDASEDRTRGPSVSSQALYHCVPIKKSKTIWIGQATMVVFPDTMYTCRDTKGGGVKIDNFFLISNFCHSKILHALIQRGGKEPGPPEKTQFIWDSIGKKQLDPPWKKCWSPSGTSENYNFL